MRTLAEIIDDRHKIDGELYKKTNLFFGLPLDDHRCYSWMLFGEKLIESLHDTLDESAIRDSSELYSEHISEKRIIVRVDGLVVIHETGDNYYTILDESKECQPDQKLIDLYHELYPKQTTKELY